MKKQIKLILARLWLIFDALTGLKENRAPVLCYHSLNERSNHDVAPMTPALFETHLVFLKEHYHVMPLKELAQKLKDKEPLPKKAVVLTFDDGYKDNYTILFPLLKKYDIPATIFLVTGFIDGRLKLEGAESWDAISWDEAREMAESGLVDFGAHTDSHIILSQVSDDRVVAEIKTSCDILEQQFGRPVTLFAYPFGQGSHIPVRAIDSLRKRAKILCACSTFWRTTHKQNQILLLNRVMMGDADDLDVLKLKLNGGYDYLYYWQKLHAFYTAIFLKKGVWH